MAIQEINLIIGPSPELPSRQERLSTYVNFYLPDGQKVRLTNTEFKLARALREDTFLTRRDWAERTASEGISPQGAYERVGEVRAALNRKFEVADWEVQEDLPPTYIPHRSKESAGYRLNFKKRPERVLFIPDTSNSDEGRLVYPTPLPGQMDEGVETRLVHAPYPLDEGGIRYLTQNGWQIMNMLAETLDRDITIPAAELPVQDRRELDYFAETLEMQGIEMVNDYEVGKDGYSFNSRYKLRHAAPPIEDDEVAMEDSLFVGLGGQENAIITPPPLRPF